MATRPRNGCLVVATRRRQVHRRHGAFIFYDQVLASAALGNPDAQEERALSRDLRKPQDAVLGEPPSSQDLHIGATFDREPGTIYDAQKQFDLAEKHYSTALDINPDFSPAANNLAYLLAKQDKNMNKALSLAQKAKEMLPNDPKVMDTLGFIYYKKGLYDSAIAEFTDSLKKIPDNAMVRFHLGLTYYNKGDKDLAKTELKKALDLDQNFDKADEARKILSSFQKIGNRN